MAEKCERCGKFGMFFFSKWEGSIAWGRTVRVCFDCLSQYDQDEVRAARAAKDSHD